MSPSSKVIRFGVFEADLSARELRKSGVRIKLQEQPFQLLQALLERPGEVVTRDELRQRVWPGNTFVDFDHGLYSAVTRLREALADSAESPRFIETVARRGYRFIAPVLEEPGPATPQADSAFRPAWHVSPPMLAAIGALIAAIVGIIALAARSPRPVTLAVLPFANPSGSEIGGYAAGGIARSLTDSLSNVASPLLRVKAHSLATSPSASADPVRAGRDLGVDVIVTGQVTDQERGLLIHGQLLRVADGIQLWAADYSNQTLSSLPASQQEMTADIVSRLPIRLSDKEREGLAKPLTRNREAEALMDRASVLFYQATPESLTKCIEYSQAAIALDPTYVSPYGEIASAYSLLSLTDVLPSREAHQKVVEWSNKAIAINDSVYISRIALLGEQATYEWDWTGIAKVGRLHPFYANLLKATGRVTELAALTARDADKLTEVIPSYYAAEAFYYNRQYAEAIDQYKRTLELSPSFLPAQFGLGRAYTQANKPDEAIEQTRKAMPLRRTAGWLGYALARFGRRSEASRVLDELKRRAHTEYVSPLNLAWIYIGLADWEQAFTWMQRACDQRVPRLLELRSEPLYDPLRLDPRYRDLIHCVGVDVER